MQVSYTTTHRNTSLTGPIENKDIPLIKAIQASSRTVILTPVEIQLDDGRKCVVDHVHASWSKSLAWVPRFQGIVNRDGRIFTDPEVLAFKSFGEVLSNKLNLCTAILNLVDKVDPTGFAQSVPYKSGLDWWMKLVREHKSIDFSALLNRPTKSDMESAIQQDLNLLKKWENPCNVQTEKHHFNLMEAAILIANIPKRVKGEDRKIRIKREIFRDGVWRDYIDSLKVWKKDLHTNQQLTTIYSANGFAYRRINGRQVECLSESRSSFLKNVRGRKRNFENITLT